MHKLRTLRLDWSSLAAVGLFLTLLILVRPFGDYPLNDDWQYAWVAKRFADTGIFRVDVGVAPSLFGQSLLVYPLIQLFGFSHMLLRSVTWVLSCVLIITTGRLLSLCKLGSKERFCSLLLLVVNPLFFNLASSFMTEIYGLTLAFLSVLIWMEGRNRADLRGDKPLISWRVVFVSAFLGSASFWIRQTCSLIYPVVVLSSLAGTIMKDGGLVRVKKSLARVATAAIVVVGVIYFYFPWATLHSVIRQEFVQPLSHAAEFDFDSRAIVRGWTAMLFYMTLFFLPFLIASRKQDLFQLRFVPAQVLIFFFACLGLSFISADASQLDWIGAWVQPHFPFLPNVVMNGALGTITLSDVYNGAASHVMDRPNWGDNVGWIITVALLLLTPLWGGVFVGGFKNLRAQSASIVRELGVFGWIFCFLMTACLIQAFRAQIFDRYHFPTYLALLVSISVVVGIRKEGFGSLQRFVLVLLPIAYFTIAGTHDYFRWNDTRWQIFREATRDGIEPSEIDGGYEINGWTQKTLFKPGVRMRYRIVMTPTPGFRTLAVYPVSGWLSSIPPLIFEVRD